MQWDFKNLRQYQGCGFTYDASGLRKSKTHSNVGIKYHWAGDKLIAEKRTTAHTKLLGSYIPQDNLVGGPQSGMYLREDHMYVDYIYGTTGILGFTLQKNNGAVEKYWYSKMPKEM